MKKIERIADEMRETALRTFAERGSLICSDCYMDGVIDGIRRGIELCREMMRNGPHGVVIWEHDIDQMLDYLDGDAITKDDALRSINNAMKFELEKQAMRKEEAEE